MMLIDRSPTPGQTPNWPSARAEHRNRPLRVMILAEACNPSWSSVPLVGYNMARALANRDDLNITVVTHVRNRPALEGDPLAQLASIEFIDNDKFAGPAYKLGRFLRGGQSSGWSINTAFAWPSYIAFERMVYRRFSSAFREGQFDLIHRVTPVSPVMGSPLAKWAGVPMILGPLNGGLPWPREYSELRRTEKEWLIPFRGLHRMLPFYKSTYQAAAGVITASEHTSAEIPRGKGKRFFMAENGVDPTRFPISETWHAPEGPFRFIFVGRLAAGKGCELILRAIGSSSLLRSCRLTLIGDGVERSKLESIVEEHELADVVEFTGWLDQPSISARLRASQAFVFPSLKEFGGGAVMEAMSAALPSIVVDYGGPGEIISPSTGIRLPIVAKDELIANLRVAMEQLATNHSLCRSMGEAAADRVRTEFVWSAKAEKIVKMYHDVVDVHSPSSST